MVGASRAAIGKAEDHMVAALDTYLTRVRGVVLARVKGPRARKGTRWWGDTAKALYAPRPGHAELEVKALDAHYALPDKLVTEVADIARPVALRVAYDAAADTAAKLGVTVPDERGDGMFAIDHDAVNKAVEHAVTELLGVAKHHAAIVREAITGADASAETLDEVLDQIEAAAAKGGNWLKMSGRTLANGLMQDTALSQARALGVTHAQWLSRRDDRVRPTHVIADGQERPIGEKFQVGRFRLLHPGDPTDLPDSWPELANCRCSLLFRRLDDDHRQALRAIVATRPGQPGPGAAELLAAAARAARSGGPAPLPAGIPQADHLEGDPVAVTLRQPVVGYRTLSGPSRAVAGQWITLPGAIVLGLLAPAVIAEGAPALAVYLPAATVVTVVGGAIVLPQGQPLEVLAAGVSGVQARPARPPASP